LESCILQLSVGLIKRTRTIRQSTTNIAIYNFGIVNTLNVYNVRQKVDVWQLSLY